MKFLAELLAKSFDFWHKFISTALPQACRHEPSCSVYGAMALREHGLMKGLGLSFWRIVRCNPWGSYGYDPVPKRHS